MGSCVIRACFALASPLICQTIEVPVSELEPFVFGIVRRKDKKTLLQEARDLVCVCVSTTRMITACISPLCVASSVRFRGKRNNCCLCLAGGLLPCAAEQQAARELRGECLGGVVIRSCARCAVVFGFPCGVLRHALSRCPLADAVGVVRGRRVVDRTRS